MSGCYCPACLGKRVTPNFIMKVKKPFLSGLVFWVITSASLLATVPVEVQTASSTQGVVVSGHPQATQIGIDVLKQGGSAIDASIAVSLALGVAEPYGSGLGGKLMMLYYEASTGETSVIDALDAAPHSIDLDLGKVRALSWAERRFGWNSICIPGLPAGLEMAYRNWGTLPWKTLVEPSIALAREGFRIEPKTYTLFEERLERIQQFPEMARIYLPNGEIPAVGAKLECPDLARTLEVIAEEGIGSVYEGTIAKALVAAAAAEGASFTMDDLRRYEARLTKPVELDFAGALIQTSPPPTTGAAMSFPVMKLVEPILETNQPQRSPMNLSLIAHAWEQVKPRVYDTIGDSEGALEAFGELLSEPFLAPIREGLEQIASTGVTPELEDRDGSTTHFVVVDSHGNMVSCTQSLSLHFGSGIVIPGTGIILNDTMSNFDFAHPENPNAVAGGKRPRSTISPTLIFRGKKPMIAIGLPGGSQIPTAMMQVMMDRLLWGRSLDQGIGDIRYHIDPARREDAVDTIESESGLAPDVVEYLPTVGWTYKDYEPAGSGIHFGGFTAIEILQDGSYIGYADPRRTNDAKGVE